MPTRFVLEICLESVDHAVAAERGGANRIELCSDLASGGITPSAGLMQTARRHVSIPIHVLIRPRAGDFCYSDHEFETMRDDIHAAKQTGMNGLVLGVLKASTRVDVERTKKLVDFAHPMPVTFHRAFDLAKDLATALEDVIHTGASRILTSGGEITAIDGLLTLTRLTEAAKNRIRIMPCGGINSANIARILRITSAREIHTSLGASNSRPMKRGKSPSHGVVSVRHRPGSVAFETKVGRLVSLLNNISQHEQVGPTLVHR